jgi:capsular exopolysaccharide synthesis family protein
MSASIEQRPASSPPPPTRPVGTLGRERAAATASTIYALARKHWPTVVAATMLGAGIALLISKSVPKVYEASALIELNANVVRPLAPDNGGIVSEGSESSWWDSQAYYGTQFKIIVSERVLETVARDLNLAVDSDFFRDARPPKEPHTIEQAAGVLRGRVRVEPVKVSRLFTLYVEDTDPRRARTICSAIANTYIDQNLQNAIAGSSEALVWLDGQLDHVKQELASSENALHEFKERNELPSTSINEASNMVRLEMQEYDTALTRIRTKKEELQARYNQLAKVGNDNPDELPSSELLNDVFLQRAREQYLLAAKERRSLLAEGKGENHPVVRAAAERVAQGRAALLAEVSSIKGAVERDLAVVAQEEAGERQLFDSARKRAVDLNMKEIEFHRLDRTREQNEKIFAMLLERAKEADLARMMRVNNIRLVDDALEPFSPVRPRTAINVAVGAFLGVLFGVAFSFLRIRLDRSIKTPDDIEEGLGVTFLGLLPELQDEPGGHGGHGRRRGRRRGLKMEAPSELVVHYRPLSGVAEAARAIRTNLMFMNPDRPYRKLLITSAAPTEGKTTVACSTAIALAHGGQRVCLVDCDLRRPRIHRIFDRAGDAGVTNVLVGEATVDEVAKPTGIDNLWSIPAGPTPPNPADMLHSERFRKFITELGERFDRVIVDSPPVVAVTDSAIISTLMDGTVFVVRAFKTNRHLSGQGLRALFDVDAKVVGAVLNAVNLNRSEYSYYYHYYYYKRDGYASTPAQSSEEAGGASPSPPS